MGLDKCAVPGCEVNSIPRHRFPNFKKDLPRFQEWLNCLRNAALSVMTHQEIYDKKKVCHRHFDEKYVSSGSKRLHQNAIPTLFVPTEAAAGQSSELIVENSPDWVPSLEMGYVKDEVVLEKAQIEGDREERASKRRKCLDDMSEFVPDLVPKEEGDIAQLEDQKIETHKDKECQTNITAEDFTAKLGRVEWCFNFLRDNDVKTKYYTGLNTYKKLEILIKNLIDYVPVNFNTSLPVHDQVLLTMIKLRLNLDFKDLSYRFGISPPLASTYFKAIIEIIYERMKSLIVWPSREILKKTMPTCFTDSFGTKISVIIDCFELFIENPSDSLRSAQCWSNYKHHHTVKYLIGITPQGTVSFISEAWGGRASDEQVVINSKFMDHIIPGDVVLADRGFLIQDHLKLFRAELQIFAFTKGKKQLHPLELETTRAIAQVGIHVERIIGSIRQKYRILSDNVPITLLATEEDDPILDKIVTVCCALINICPPIAPLSS